MSGFLKEITEQDYKSAVEFYRSAITVLEWGLVVWKDVSQEDRGAIFALTFVRAIRRFLIEAYMVVCLIYVSIFESISHSSLSSRASYMDLMKGTIWKNWIA